MHLATGVKGRTGQELVDGYNILYERLIKAVVKPVIQQLDNEALKALINCIEAKGLNIN